MQEVPLCPSPNRRSRPIGTRTSRSRPSATRRFLPDRYDSKGYQPDMVPFWPSDKPLFLPENMVPEQMKKKGKTAQ